MEKKKKRLITRTVLLVVMVLAIGYTVYAAATKDKHAKLSIGDTAPDFVLEDLDGNKHKLSDYKGQGVFLNFWGTWCPPCEKEMPAMNRQYDVYKDQGIQILAANVGQSNFEASTFAQRYDLNFPILLDTTRGVKDSYSVINLPATYLISPEGKVVDIITGEMSDEQIASYLEAIKPQ